MRKRRVLVLCTQAQTLFGEGLEFALSELEDVEVIGPWAPGARVLARLPEEEPDIVLVAEGDRENWASLTTQILEQCPDLPVIRIQSKRNAVSFYTPQERVLPARVASVIEAIQALPVDR